MGVLLGITQDLNFLRPTALVASSMDAEQVFFWSGIALIGARWVGELGLDQLNRLEIRRNAGAVPKVWAGLIDPETYRKAVRYALDKSQLSRIESSVDAAVLLLVVVSGVLPALSRLVVSQLGQSAWSLSAWMLAVGLIFRLANLPLDWHSQFHLEERYGFNRTTPKLWWSDHLKSFLLAGCLVYFLLVLILKLMDWTGALWWLWGWAMVVAFQLLMAVVAPVLIFPLFNRFTPLPEGGLRRRLEELCQRLDFRHQSIQVMDGSRRSKHSNAFFTGFGRYRRVVLFDTLIEQLSEEELVAVVAHEIGHYKERHIPKLFAGSALILLVGFGAVAGLAGIASFSRAFGFEGGPAAVDLLLCGLLGGTVLFWLSPLLNWWSRQKEYEADAFAADASGSPAPLIEALRKLAEKNLSNLTPHWLYSRFYYSHPTLPEREEALKQRFATAAQATSRI